MDENIPNFTGGTQSANEKLNRIVGKVNQGIRGDEQFIGVQEGPAGKAIFLNVNNLISRIPKFYDLPGFPALITGNDGSPSPYFYSFQKLIDTDQPHLAQQTPIPPGLTGDGTTIYAVNGYDTDMVLGNNGNYNLPVPTNTVVWMYVSFDEAVPPKPVYRFWYLDNTVGTFCDTEIPIYTDTQNVQATSFESYDFEVDFDFITGLIGTRAKVSWGGLSAVSYLGTPYCHIKILKFDQITNPVGTPASTDMYLDVDTYTKLPLVWETSTGMMASPCDSCDPNERNFLGFNGYVLLPPGGSLPVIKHNGTVVGSGTGQYPIYDMEAGIIPTDNTTYVAFAWSGFFAQDYTGTQVGTGDVNSGGGYTTVRAGAANVVMSDLGSNVLGISAGVFGDNGSGSLGVFNTLKNNGGVALTDLGGGVLGISAGGASSIGTDDCINGSVGNFSTIQSGSGIEIYNALSTLGLKLRISNGTYIQWDFSGCSAIADIPTNTFDLYGSATTAQSNAQSYTDTAIGGLSGTYDPLGAAATAQSNAEAYSDSQLAAALAALFATGVQYSPGNPSNWSGTPPSTVQEMGDRLAANNAAILGALGAFGIPGLPGNP